MSFTSRLESQDIATTIQVQVCGSTRARNYAFVNSITQKYVPFASRLAVCEMDVVGAAR